jgi:pre-mRNA-splicing factor CDC5/CEF1
MTKQATKAGKLEKRLGVTLGGYQARSQTLTTQLLTTYDDLQNSALELASFKNLRIMEEAAVNTRLEALNKEVVYLGSRESLLQQKWDGLNREKQDMMERIEKLHQIKKQREEGKEQDEEDIGPEPMEA